MSKTVKQLLEHCRKAKDWKYVYGMKGSVMSLNQYNNLKRLYGSMVWVSDKNKVGKVCCDCSGLISSCTGITRGSSEYKSTAKETATINQLKANWSKYIGWGIWKNGHIGVVSDTPGYYYAMDGSAANWVHKPISAQNWQYVIKLIDIDYSANEQTKADVFYQVRTQGKIYAEVKNLEDYAGVENRAVTDLAVKVSKGSIKYRVHVLGGGWLPFVDGYNWNDVINGYAGDGKKIDAMQVIASGCGGKAKYRVSTIGSTNYLPWVYDDQDYAGIIGKAIDKVQVAIE